MTTTSNLGIYIHIPFCVRKCNYCDFLSFGCDDSRVLTEYTNALIEEIKIRSIDWHYREVDSVYIGGGTPSLLSEWDMGKILDSLRDNYNINEDAEITVETNPASLTDEKMERYLRKGVNRISLGVQSFDNRILETLGRVHNKNDAFYSYQRLKKAGFDNINLDMMFGIPGQTMKIWKDTVRQCIFLEPTHISLYSLQIEESTPFYKMIYEDGKLEPTPEAVDREMYHTALKMMRTAGYDHYEISNVALRGYRSRHNLKYWSYNEYLGLGLGASSFLNGIRCNNYDKMNEYIGAIKESTAPVDAKSVENYTEKEEMGIFIFTALRKSDGVSLQHFKKVFGKELFEIYDRNILNKYKGMLIFADDRLYLSERGMDISNRIMTEFI